MEDLLEKHSKLLPPHHYLLLNLKLDLMNEYGKIHNSASIERRQELLRERMDVLGLVDGGEESRLMGFMYFKQHMLLVEKLVMLQRSGSRDFEDVAKELSSEVKRTLIRATKLLKDDIGCPEELQEMDINLMCQPKA